MKSCVEALRLSKAGIYRHILSVSSGEVQLISLVLSSSFTTLLLCLKGRQGNEEMSQT